MTYPNGEKYFGMYQKEFRNKQGIYVYQPKIEGDKLLILLWCLERQSKR